MRGLRVCVAGRSVAGLTSAALLARSPLVESVTLIAPTEIAHQNDRFSTGLWSAALGVLQFGLGVDLSGRSSHVAASSFRSRDGRILCEPHTSMKRFQGDASAPSLHFVRNSVLLEALREAAEQGPAKLRNVVGNATRVKRSGDGSVTAVVCSSGQDHECDLFIVADGMLSPLRAQLTFLSHENFLRHRGYRVYSGYTPERVCDASFQSWGAGRRFACVPTQSGNQWFATIPSSPRGSEMDAVAAGPLSNNARAVPQPEMQALQQEFASWHAEVATLLASSSAVRSCEALAFSSVPSAGSPLFLNSNIVFLGDSGFTLDPILAQGAGLAIEEAAVYCNSLRHAASTSSDLSLLARATETFARQSTGRRQQLFWLSNASQLVGSMQCTNAAAARDVLLRATPPALKGRAFDQLIRVSNGNSHFLKK